MASLSDFKIKALVKAGKPFDGISDGDGLYLCWPKDSQGKPRYSKPFWRFRYKLLGQARAMHLGSYGALSLLEARKLSRELKARVSLGYDPAGEKQQRKIDALEKIEAKRNARTMGTLLDEYLVRYVVGKLKRPEMIRQRLDKHIRATLGDMKIEEIKPLHIDQVIYPIAERGNKRTANDILGWLKRIFDYAVTRHYTESNPATAFKNSDAGGEEKARSRALSLDEIGILFACMENAKSFARQNTLAVKLLLLLGVRKMELLAAPWEEFELDSGLWKLPAERTKTGQESTIPLPEIAINWLRELHVLACGSEYVFPKRLAGKSEKNHVSESALNMALSGLDHGLDKFVIHDFRRTTRSQLAALKIPPHICERCVNHKIKGVEGVYDRYDYFQERKEALESWAKVISDLEGENKIIPIGKAKATKQD